MLCFPFMTDLKHCVANSTKHLEQLAKKSQQGPLPESKVSSKLQLQSISNERVTVGNVEPPAQQQTGSNR